MRSHKIYWDLARSIEISQDLLRSHKIYWDLTRSSEISQDLLRSHKIYRDLIRSSDLASYIFHFVFDIWHSMTFDIWHLTFDIWHLTIDNWQLTFDIWHLTFDMTKGTRSNSTNTFNIGTIFYWWILWLSLAIWKCVETYFTMWFKRC